MDTDDLTELAWDVIIRAARVSATLKAELGSMASRFKAEDEWLQAVKAHLKSIAADPGEYVDAWGVEDGEEVTAAMMGRLAVELCRRADKILATPIHKRGKREW